MPYYFEYDFGLCVLRLIEQNKVITHIQFVNERTPPPPTNAVLRRSRAISAAARQLEEYFYSGRTDFDFAYALPPTFPPFMRCVLEELSRIPYGEVRSYKEIAEQCGSPKAARAVGGACAKNPLVILLPCHRVIAHYGGIGGFGGGLEVKRRLLELERC